MTSPIGRIGLRLDERDHLIALDFLGDRGRSRPPASLAGRRIVAALLGYFADPTLVFTIPLVTAGTSYQQRVWAALRQIPPGSACTYGELAQHLDSAPRAVGQACRHNPIPIIIPCHRVLARDGAGGYGGATRGPELAIKHWLLAHEGVSLPT